MSTAPFGPATAAWFGGAFEQATPAQQGAWQAISSGRDTLVVAPTGSGKTLAAFLWSIDRLAHDPAPTPMCRVLYVSPLKALAVDVERNLRSPLVGITREATRLGLPAAPLTVGVRTGDTPADERRRQASAPPDILITTPESLFLLMTSAARTALRGVQTVIIDEIHAIAGTKRGAHLAVTLERLEELLRRDDAERAVQRIGLSATVRPIDEVARFLRPGGDVAVVAPVSEKRWDLSVRVPVPDMSILGTTTGEFAGSAAGDGERTSIWPYVERAIVDEVGHHRSTLVFANSRRLAERLTASLNEEWAERHTREDAAEVPALMARAHHGSVSREQRTAIEEDLKAGRLPAVVATSSLELGIDMGAVDLVVQVEAPPSVASGLQRIGRAGHQVGAVSRGVLFPKYRGDLVSCAVVADRMRSGEIESLAVPANPLDVLAQQLVAMVAMDDWSRADALAAVRRSAPYADLPESAFDAVLDMLAGRYPGEEFAELRPRLIWDRTTDLLTARPGAQRLAVTSGGTIPDRGLFAVVLLAGGRIGELDEEMVYESSVGDVFALGATSWRIEDITHDRVIVSPAPGQPGRMPFWHGDSIGRPLELGRATGAFVRDLAGLDASDAHTRLTAMGLDAWAAENLVGYLAEQRAATTHVPDDRTIVVERFRDEIGDWRVVIHSPFGARVHAPWALALASRLRTEYDVDAQMMHADDGIVLRLPDTLDDEAVRAVADSLLIEPEDIAAIVTREVGGSALFASRFRECAARALLLPRRAPGRRMPLWQQRQRSSHLLAVASSYPQFPIVLEAVRECLSDVYDLPGLTEVLTDVRERRVRVVDVETDRPSPFAHSLLFGYVAQYLYDGDAPLAERRAAALTLDSALLAELLGQQELSDLLDADAVAEVCAAVERRGPLRDAEDLADLLRTHGPFSHAEAVDRRIPPEWLELLVAARRVITVRIGGEDAWAAIEDAGRLRDALGTALPVGIPEAFLDLRPDPVGDLVARHARTHGPFTAEEVATRFGVGVAVVTASLDRLAERGAVLRGSFVPGTRADHWCDAEVLRRIRRRSVANLRQEAEPVDPAVLGSFLPAWHGIPGSGAHSRSHARGLPALVSAIEQLAGAALPASALETLILPARVADYSPAMLDQLTSSGEVVWWGAGSLPGGDGWIRLAPADIAPDLVAAAAAGADAHSLHERLLDVLRDGGAWFFRSLSDRVGQGGAVTDDVLSEALWDLVWEGRVTNDTLAPLRARLGGRRTSAARAPSPFSSRRRGRPNLPTRTGPPIAAGRWSILGTSGAADHHRSIATAEALLGRYGIVTRAAVQAEGIAGGFAAVYRTLSALEEAGRCRRAYALEGLGGAQFAAPGAVDRVRDLDRARRDGARSHATPCIVVLAAADPAQPFGALLPWPTIEGVRPTRSAGAVVVLVDGVAVLHLERGGRSLSVLVDDSNVISAAGSALARALSGHGTRASISRINTVDVASSPWLDLLAATGMRRTPRGLRI